ncbi:hypothetical protein BKA65DRAFT_550224 [Rhexocercosporidium sp. MPI-PUGE-AT-0058]|nr:hypothetical protein BKA65DRAFT_550224 [Rhexocercosporidium sp. MPI-PUGE-AT-0058]
MSPYSFLKRHISFKRSPISPPGDKEAISPPVPTYRAAMSPNEAIPHQLSQYLQRSPPPSPYSQTPPPRLSLSSRRISPSSTPQWTWTNAHCKAWLYEVCTTLLNYSVEDAQAMCEKFLGFGPTLYAMDRADWEALLGQYNGMGVYSLLLSARHQAGAVPESVDMLLENGERVSREGGGNRKEKKAKRVSWRRKS